MVEWSLKAPKEGMRCGNTNPLKADEVFTLRPEESRMLTGCMGHPYLTGEGRDQVSLSYKNEPRHKLLGEPLGEHDKKALERIRNSTPVSLTSNAVEVVVER